MKRESREELRARLLADEQVRAMIAMRAYEIYQFRGGAPGHEAEDWLQAEAEILKFLIEEESHSTKTEGSAGSKHGEPELRSQQVSQQTGPAAEVGEVAVSEVSVREAEATELVAEPLEVEVAAPKTTGARAATTKPSSPRKRKTSEKSAIVKASAKKKSTKASSSKKGETKTKKAKPDAQ